MSSASTAPPPPPASASPGGPRKAYRDTEAGVVGGVAAGLAEHLRIPVLWVRVFFVAATALHLLGAVLYVVFWFFLPVRPAEAGTPGGESASRGGRRPGPFRRLRDKGPVVALAVLGLGLVIVVENVLGGATDFWLIALGLVGVALLWRQADEAQRERWTDTRGRLNPVRMVFGSGGWAAWARVGAGVAMVIAAFGLFALRGGSVADARQLTVAFVVGLVGVVVVIGPWAARLVSDLGAERAERVRSQERADVAAHLHDSVLQTLALIQRNADDPAAVSRLARAQERDLRTWLYEQPADQDSVVQALRAAAAEIEDAHGVTVDVVAVGDAPLDEALRPLVAAAREAIANAARHAGVPRVDVYAEAGEGAFEVFVRDRGKGFVPADVPADRHGVRDSIVDRMARHGGTAEVRSTPGEGTEVRLRQTCPTKDEAPGQGGEEET